MDDKFLSLPRFAYHDAEMIVLESINGVDIMLRFDGHTDFNAYLEKIDAEMRRDNVPIRARQLQALSRISSEYGDMEFNISYAMTLKEDDIVGYEGDALTRRIIIWFEELYGDLLKISFLGGKSVALVRGDPYLMNIPIVLGNVKFASDVETLGQSGRREKDGKTLVNVFDCLSDITEATIVRVSRSDGFRLANELRANTYRFRKATEIGEYENVFDIRTDLDSAAQHIVTGRSSFGMSRWHSLQVAEKALKSVLSCQMLDFPKVHDLFELVHASGMLGISPLALDAAMCLPSVRYESDHSTLDQAINAHHASLDICLEAAGRVADVEQRRSDQRPKWAKQLD